MTQDFFSQIDGENSRIRNYNVNMELILAAPIFGYGLGKERQTMQANRNEKSWEYKNNYHAHNQYFESLLGGGVILLLLILSLLALLLRKALFNTASVYATSFVVILLYSFLIESILRRHHGILFFSFFLFLLYFYDVGTSNKRIK
ncbi:hypothetical protein GCM10011412_12720 [Maribacter cobaltidurans]|nr:hypothetical protein GCM10011412_12720 [Maribacter cobaltidurans]